jgi:hypothetical protein
MRLKCFNGASVTGLGRSDFSKNFAPLYRVCSKSEIYKRTNKIIFIAVLAKLGEANNLSLSGSLISVFNAQKV